MYTVLATHMVGEKRVYREATVRGSLVDARRQQLELQEKLQGVAHAAEVKGTQDDGMDSLVAQWLTHQTEIARVARSTQLRHAENTKRFVLPYFKGRALSDLTRRDLVKFLEWLPLQKSRSNQEYSRVTLHNAWRTAAMFFRWASLETDTEPLTNGVRFNVKGGKDEKVKQPLSQEELNALLTALINEPDRYRIPLWLCGSVGCRIGEATAIYWEDVDFTHDVITLRRSQNAGVVNQKTKTKVIRIVPMVKTVREMLLAVKPAEGAEGLIFRNTKGGLMAATLFQEPLARACSLAGLDRKVSPHIFRRSVNDYVRKVADKQTAMALLGHLREEMHDLYSSSDMEQRRAAVDSMLELDAGQPNTAPTVQ